MTWARVEGDAFNVGRMSANVGISPFRAVVLAVNPGAGAEGEIRTPTGCPTAPSRQRVCQFHHLGLPFGASASEARFAGHGHLNASLQTHDTFGRFVCQANPRARLQGPRRPSCEAAERGRAAWEHLPPAIAQPTSTPRIFSAARGTRTATSVATHGNRLERAGRGQHQKRRVAHDTCDGTHAKCHPQRPRLLACSGGPSRHDCLPPMPHLIPPSPVRPLGRDNAPAPSASGCAHPAAVGPTCVGRGDSRASLRGMRLSNYPSGTFVRRPGEALRATLDHGRLPRAR